MNNCLVSVVVPIYNVEKYLDKCIESIVNQTYKNLEIILVDDGSSDNCPAMCDQWAKKDCRIKVIHKSNEGAGFARNTGIDNATGEYICFFDSDDCIDCTLIEKCVAKATQNNAQVVLYGKNNIRPDGTVVGQTSYAKDAYFDDVQSELLAGLFSYSTGHGISVWSKFFKLSVIIENNIKFKSERELLSEDAYFILQFFSKISKAVTLKENLYNYYERENSLSRNTDNHRQKKNDMFLSESLNFISQAQLPQSVASGVKVRYHIYTITALKQIVQSNLPDAQKRKALQDIYKNSTLQSTLTNDVLKLENKNQRLFFAFLKYKAYSVCNLLLKFNSRR